ncbi:type IV pilus assembly protein PilM [Seleniivibrio woodruffii]|uniref:type IV pilus assembly protein PilM n=1 Tax=Seleniivibrio woodruffii TaxID=1078050 RepID=UPI0039E27217
MAGYLLGVDAGASNLKIVELKEKKGDFTVKNLFLRQMPSNVIVDGTVIDHGAASFAIKEALALAKGLTKDAALGMRGRDSIVKHMEIPWNGKGNFQETFIWSADQYIGIPASKATFDAQLLSYDEERGVAEAVVAAAGRDKVADCIAMAELAGLNPVVVDIEALALVNLLTMIYGKKKHPDAVIDLGHDCTNIIFYDKGFVDYVKSIPKGCKFLMEELAQDMDMDIDKAAEVIRDREVMTNDVDAQAAAMSFGSTLGAEIETAVESYIAERRKEPVDIRLCGAGANLSVLTDQMEIAMRMSLPKVDPFAAVELPEQLKPIAMQAGACAFAVAVGLAMRKA